MKLAVATYHVPHPEGTSPGRQLWALGAALQAAGHDLVGWCWGPDGAVRQPPDWCEWRPFDAPRGWRVKPVTLAHPRWDLAKVGWRPPDGYLAWADCYDSFPAIAGYDPAVLTVHRSVALDVRATGRWTPSLVQDWRAERRSVRTATRTVALTERVAGALGVRRTAPATVPIPEQALPLVEEPVALMLANWHWAPNRVALDNLHAQWGLVRERVAGARLLLAGRGLDGIAPSGEGVEVVGEVASTVDAMARAAVLAFPCPPSSGPKLKVLDALAAGLPVVTTDAGVEGLDVPPGAVTVVREQEFASALSDVLADPSGRARMAEQGRAAVLAHHSPDIAVRQWLSGLFG